MREPRPFLSRIFNVIWNLKTRGYSDRTIDGYSKRLKMLNKHVNLDNSNDVNCFIARQDRWSNSYKEGVVNAYVHYVRMYNLKWEKPVYKRSQRLPNVPTTVQVDKIIAKSGRKYSLVFSILRDTGLRPIELHGITMNDIDLERGLIYPESAKGGRPRVLKLKSSTLAMLKEYICKNNYGPKDEMEQFGIEQGLEGEKYAHSEEAKFLKRLRFVVPHLVDIKLFRVRSWVRTGIPNYEIKPTKIMARKQVKEMFKSVRDNKKNLQKFTAVKSYKNEMSEQKTEKYSILSSILKLDNVKKDFPIVEMEFLDEYKKYCLVNKD